VSKCTSWRIFLWYYGLNSGPCACWAGALPHESHTQPPE
jgi:hypothetical protein